jgi:alpha-mannosidase
VLHNTLWTPQKIAQRIQLIEPLVYRQRQTIPAFRYRTLSSPLVEPPVGIEVDDREWEMIEPKTYWGTWFTDFILRTQFTVPHEWGKSAPVALYLPLGEAGDFSHPEALAYIDGEPYASADRHHQEILLPTRWQDGQPHTLALHGWTGLGGWENGDLDTKLYMRECAVVQIDQPTRDFLGAAKMALSVAKQLDDNDPVKGRLYNALDAAFKVVDTRHPLGTEDFYHTVPKALETLRTGVKAAGAPMDVDVIGVGHAHIDVAWLWTLGHTRRKAGRTFSNVLRMMEQYPEYKFTQSQPQLYQYTQENYPQIFEQIQQRVKEGRWELIGGTWVEPDCNAIGAESLARQFLLGRSFFRKHFGDVDTPLLWLPDTFGYSWALPQLIKLAGMKYFITHKMSWNQYNQMPHQILWWQGIDGTRVLTHFLTTLDNSEYLPHATTYNGQANAKEIFATWKNFRQKETHNELITAYGYGDGGGGPTREMIENIQNLAEHAGAPRVRPGTVREFMDRLEREVSGNLPVWNGEFYLEYHRGTFTSQARNKRNNRKSEFLLHDAEFLAAMAAQFAGYDYPRERLSHAWELVCLNQFHDILPGSSIGPVYIDSDEDYRIIRNLGESVLEEAVEALAHTLPAGTAALVANPTSFGGRRIGLLREALSAGQQPVDARSGTPLASQVTERGTLIEFPDIAPYAVIPVRMESGSASSANGTVTIRQTNGGASLENELLLIEFDDNGAITRLYDKTAQREVLASGEKGNVLLAFEDRPMNYDAWDIDIYYEDRVEQIEGVESFTIIETGPLRAGLEIIRRYRNSQIIQRIYLYRGSKRLDFDTYIDWHEHHTLLKVAFPVNILSPTATFDIQWGNVQRPTHRNTSWDWARFETCAHKWADLSEGNYGVALLNDCKYGYDIHDHVMRLTLLKSATSPDPNADQGEHLMTYSLLPHEGDWRSGGVPAAAYDLNDPLIVRRVPDSGAGSRLTGSFLSVDQRNVIIETVKQAEDGNGVIVRLFENERSRGRVTLTTGFPLADVYVCNLLEENDTKLEIIQGNQVRFEMRPYQILNLRLIPQLMME